MAGGDTGSPKPDLSPYDEAMDALSSLITKRSRADKSNKGDRFDLLFDYIKTLELEDQISKMKIIHVAGTKGKGNLMGKDEVSSSGEWCGWLQENKLEKIWINSCIRNRQTDSVMEFNVTSKTIMCRDRYKGSTCTFTEAILRNCGFRTGLFTSPHLIDVRERFRLNGVDICEEKFLAYFWWSLNRLKEKTSDDQPMPTYFRFLALLAFKIFAAEQVDVAILEVGLGGTFDATNVVQTPIVCGISSLGYDHMEILGNTLGEIAGEKAGIFKKGVPAFTVPQPDEAMRALEEKASKLDVPLRVATPLDTNLLKGQHLGLVGNHQYLNAGLAIALCSTWLQKTGHLEVNYLEQDGALPEEFIKGLTTATLQGRAQMVTDQFIDVERKGDLVFYLDGAHSPESMEVCADWFSLAIKEDNKHQKSFDRQANEDSRASETSGKNTTPMLLFNCMSVRDPQLLLPRLVKTCSSHGVHFKKAIFVPNTSVYYKVGSSSLPPTASHVDLSWQLSLQRVWENLIHGEKGDAKNATLGSEEDNDDTERCVRSCEDSAIFPSLPLAIKWLRDTVQQNQSVRFQVLVTGSLHLVGDVLRLVKK